MLYAFRLLTAAGITFSLLSSAQAQTDYCREARPSAYLEIADMVKSANGIYLVRANNDEPEKISEPIQESQIDSLSKNDPHDHSAHGSDSESDEAIIPSFKSELQRMTQGRKNPDRLTLKPSGAFKTSQNFTVLETISGDKKSLLSLSFTPNLSNENSISSGDFNAHTDEAFWSDLKNGRTPLNKQCQIKTSYTVGQTYLIFEGLDHPKGAELINTSNDKWLTHIRSQTANANK